MLVWKLPSSQPEATQDGGGPSTLFSDQITQAFFEELIKGTR
jgi:hypothetical protein